MKDLRNISTSYPTDGSCAAGLILQSERRNSHCWGVAGMFYFILFYYVDTLLNLVKIHLFALFALHHMAQNMSA